MKKIIALLLLLITLTGCSEDYRQVYSVGVLEKEENDEAVFVFLDENRKVIKEVKTTYPSCIFFSDERIFYSTDDLNYKSIRTDNFKDDMFLENVGGNLIAVNDDGSFFVQREEMLQFVRDGKREEYECTVLFSNKDDEYLYVIDDSFSLISFRLSDGSVAEVYYLPALSFVELCVIDGHVYLADEVGYTELKDGKRGTTFLYPDNIGEVSAVNRNLLFTYIGDEKAVYKVSFEKYSVNLEYVLDESYYTNYNFEEIFHNYYSQDYEILNYFTFLFK